MCPIEIAANTQNYKHRHNEPIGSSPETDHHHHHHHQRQEQRAQQDTSGSSTSPSNKTDQQQQQQEDNNNNNHRKRSCSSTSSSLATEKRRSQRLLKKHIEEEQQIVAEICRKEKEATQSMLSKIKQSAAAAAAAAVESRAQSFHNNNNNNDNNNNNNESDNEDNEQMDQNDSNNNQLEQAPIQPGKLTQDELMDIVEVSRKRRLSKGSADTLGSFIRWSFTHIEAKQKRRDSFTLFEKQNTLVIENNNNNNNNNGVQSIKNLARAAAAAAAAAKHSHQHDDELLDDEDDWSTLSHHQGTPTKLQTTEQLLRQHAKLGGSSAGGGGGSTTANLALLRHQNSLMAAQEASGARLIKRPRLHTYSPELKHSLDAHSPTSNRKVSSYLGNVVDRLHQQQQHHHNQQQQLQTSNLQQEADTSGQAQEGSNSGLSYHLQQFLSQQTSLEDLCSSVGLDDSNQLVLAAAIHRALVDSVGPQAAGQANNEGTAKSTASSTGGSSSGSTSSNSAGVSINQASAGANMHLVDALGGQRRRTYNTRGGGGGSAAGVALALNQAASAAAATTRQHSSSTAATLAALNINSRVQQQRHAQAAAALSALANAGSHHASHQSSGSHVGSPATPISQLQQQHSIHQHQHHHHHQHPGNHQLQASLSGGNSGGQSLAAASNTTGAGATGNPMVDFECETCGSSFDDRHRLMQHQSIHLELKKDWFTETPVDEVMKIFNRRRGEFLCNTCNLRFEATFDYDKHNHQVHGQRPYCCQFCGNGTRTFRFWRQYLNHLYDHRYIFSCTIEDCDFTVNRRDSLRFHIFRFHLNCQLPQQQTHIRSAGHQHNMMLGGEPGSKWPLSMGHHHDGLDDDVDDLDQDTEMNLGD